MQASRSRCRQVKIGVRCTGKAGNTLFDDLTLTKTPLLPTGCLDILLQLLSLALLLFFDRNTNDGLMSENIHADSRVAPSTQVA